MSERERAVLTGGSTGIGAAIARALVAGGFEVLNLDRELPDAPPHKMTTLQLDLTDADALASACDEVRGSGARTFVHNAGVIRAALVEDARAEDFDYLNRLHLVACLEIAQSLIPDMKSAGHGRIVIIASRAAVGMPTRSAYSATKAGQIALARTWALELAPSGITVNTVSPGPVAGTAMFHAVVPADSAEMRAMAERIPVGRLGAPEDVARAVMFFVDRAADFITGQNLYVCGGTSVA